MALLRVSYHDPDGRGRYYGYFVNFINSVEVLRGKDIFEVVSETLISEYGARDVKVQNGFMDVEFSDEKDITMFLLRWS